MQLVDRDELSRKLVALGSTIELVEAQQGFMASSTASGAVYHLLPSEAGWKAVREVKGSDAIVLFDGASLDEAGMACHLDELASTGRIVPEAFRHAENGIALRDSRLLATETRYLSASGWRIEISSGENRYILKNPDGSLIGAFGSARTAAGIAALSQTQAVHGAPGSLSPASLPAAADMSFTLKISKVPNLHMAPTGFARLDLVGEDADTGRPRQVSIVGDRARALHITLQAREISAARPASIAIQSRLKPRQFHDPASGTLKTGLSLEAVSSEVLPSRIHKASRDAAAEALCA